MPEDEKRESESEKDKARTMASKLKDNPRCPHCGHELDDEDTLKVSDWCLHTGTAIILDGRVEEFDMSATGMYKDEEEVTCPECGGESYLDEWGIKR